MIQERRVTALTPLDRIDALTRQVRELERRLAGTAAWLVSMRESREEWKHRALVAERDAQTLRGRGFRAYECDDERLLARRASFARSSRRRYELYKQLCAANEIRPQHHRWSSHLGEIQRSLATAEAA